tara:strand:- start:102 stop:332 length:231 start_codon:yes stop_codon:yes gene_type:complete
MNTIETIKNLSHELIVKPSQEFELEEFKASALLYVDIVETLLKNLTVDKIQHEYDNKKEKNNNGSLNELQSTTTTK